MRKLFTLLIMLVIVSKANSQCTATITASSSTSPFCQGKGVILAANSNSNWTQKANLGRGNRNGAVGFSIGSKGYIGTGWINYCCDTLKNDFWEYDPTTNIWTQKADFAGGSGARGIGFSISSKGYIVWGKQLWEYNPTTNLWTRKADFGDAGFLDIGFSIGNKGYVASAFSSKHFWEYNPTTDIWTQKADFIGETRQGAVSFSIGSKGYIGTGWNTKYKKDFWEYDPITNVWTQKADFGGVGRFYAVGFSIGNKGYIGTGRDNYLRNDFWEYVPANDVWIQRASFIGASRTDAVGFSIGNKGFLGTGGQSSVPGFSDFYEYDPELKYLWSTGDTTSYITVSTSGKYSVKITNPAKGCSATSKPKVITFEPSPSATFLQSACGSYLWNNVKYTNSGTYTQIFADPRG